MALFFSLHALVDMVSIGTIMAYTIVTVSVLSLRYQEDSLGMSRADSTFNESHVNVDYLIYKQDVFPDNHAVIENENQNEKLPLLNKETSRFQAFKRQIIMFLIYRHPEPNLLTESKAKVCVFLLIVEVFAFSGLLHFLLNDSFHHESVAIVFFAIFGMMIIITTLVLSTLPENSQKLFFKVPVLPWVPVLGLFLNVYLLLGLNTETWIRFGIWMAIGKGINYGY